MSEAAITGEAGFEGAGSAGPARAAPGVIGVVGAGTMGAGIAQLASRFAVSILHDPVADALERGLDRAKAGLSKEAAKGILSGDQASAAEARLRGAGDIAELAGCELVIEAAPERPDLKREIFERLSEVVPADCVLATNTSSLPVTGVAAAATHPERVVGMHFFNPAPLMRLVEVIAGVRSGERALEIATAAGEAMGRTVIRAADGPGFLVNRCNRPFGLEALRMLSERIADIETMDRICRLAGGFRMGPFELSDLVGVDTGFEVSLSFHELSYGEPRWRPSPLQAQRVAAGLTGRKAGAGWYEYSGDGPYRPADPEPPTRSMDARVSGDGPLAQALHALCPGREGPRIEVQGLGGAVDGEAFYALLPLASVEVTGDAGQAAFRGIGLHTERVRPSPGGVLGRIVCQLANECAFALGEGVGSAQDIDRGMVLGLNHPRGPLAWADQIGLDHVLAVLDALNEHYREERYRAAPLLRRLVLEGRLGRASGAGFFDY